MSTRKRIAARVFSALHGMQAEWSGTPLWSMQIGIDFIRSRYTADSMCRMHARRAALICAMLSACGYPEGKREIPEPDYTTFASEVYPVLLRDCGFPACHGTQARFFQVFGPGRTRLAPQSSPYDPATAQERAQTYTRACSMLIDPKGIAHSLLLRKPLARAVGGPGHGGDDVWGRGVYASRDDEGYVAIADWALSMGTPVISDEQDGALEGGTSDASVLGDR